MRLLDLNVKGRRLLAKKVLKGKRKDDLRKKKRNRQTAGACEVGGKGATSTVSMKRGRRGNRGWRHEYNEIGTGGGAF